jgi:hypothetical protein
MSVHRTIAENEAEERHNQEVARLRASRDELISANDAFARKLDRLLAAAKNVMARVEYRVLLMDDYDELKAAIAAAEESGT